MSRDEESKLMRPFITSVCLASVAGALTFISFPTAWFPDVSLYWLIWFSHVPLLWLLRNKGPKQSFYWGWFAGSVINIGGYYWIAHMLGTFGGFPTALAIAGSALHGMYLGLMWGIWALLLNRLTNTTSVGVEWGAPLCMVAVELLFPRIFPAMMGNSQFPFIHIMQICDLIGVAGVTFLIYRVNAVLFLWMRAIVENRTRPARATKVTAIMLLCSLGYGVYQVHSIDETAESAEKLQVGVVEGDVGIFQVETSAVRSGSL